MNIAFNEVAIAVLKKQLQDCSVDELQQLTDQYPYFGPAHLLLAKKLQEENSSLYEDQVQKTSLYFQNRLWLHYLLNSSDTQKSSIENKQQSDEIIVSDKEQHENDSSLTMDHEPEVINETREDSGQETIDPVETVVINNKPVAGSPAEEHNEPETTTEPVTDDHSNQISTPVEIPQLKIEPLAPGAALTFEPYHTVDYFASQGIKFKEDERPKDRFSQQLKSFTEWLKVMKRIPVTETPPVLDANNERKIELLAEHSVADRHVITEAMAEVWEKQGNTTKAEEIYHKLSLLDPSKSSYFAAKIEALKKTS